jgi:hypothetical protein
MIRWFALLYIFLGCKGLTRQLFFDDEHRNFEVEHQGVTMQLVPNSGTDRKLFEAGLTLWRKRRGIEVDHALSSFSDRTP